MNSSFRKIFLFFGISILVFLGGFNFSSNLDISIVRAATNLSGRILLQVQDLGQAWYVNPLNNKRYYLARPQDAFSLMRSLGLGVSNKDLLAFKLKAPRRLAGRILLQVQDLGQAWYVNPLNLKLYYLGRPQDAFNLMRSQGLGITNHDLSLIPKAVINIKPSDQKVPTATNSLQPSNQKVLKHWLFKYQNNSYEISQQLSSQMYYNYANSSKVYTYNTSNPPSNLRNAFYGLFLATKPGDKSLDELVGQLRSIAKNNKWTDDQLLEFTMAFVQYIPYDYAKLKLTDNRNIDPYFPYETLYLDHGVCSDKTFLAVSLIRKLGYGAAILDFPDLNHSAVGIACPVADSINGSGYCYGETTNYFPIGVIPASIDSGQAQVSVNQFSDLFDSSRLGTIKIYQKTVAKVYQGVQATKARVAQLIQDRNDLDTQKAELSSLKIDLDSQQAKVSALKLQMNNYYDSGQITLYNSLVPKFNILVASYNLKLNNYQAKTKTYNLDVVNFNHKLNNFYQK